MKNLKKYVLTSMLTSAFALSLIFIPISNDQKNLREINGKTYEIDEDILTIKDRDEDKTAVLGIISDSHGYTENVEKFSQYFKEIKAEGIIMLGDYAQMTYSKIDSDLTNYNEIESSLEAALKTGLPVYVIPGNHETKEDYTKAIETLSKEYGNLFDLSKIRMVDGDDFDLVSNPYGNGFGYFSEGFEGTEAQLLEVVNYVKKIQKDKDPGILVTHKPPKCKGKYGIDVPFLIAKDEDMNVGDENLDKFMKEYGIKFSLSGHIHEAGGRGVTADGDFIPPEEFVDEMRLNPGAASPQSYWGEKFYEGSAMILTIEDGKAKYRQVVRKAED
ncbi:MAG: metallophosphoesterase [Nanoarchaeota archaeon]|nr:metallophosphoesterase [Nanoarchaeota archaeon]